MDFLMCQYSTPLHRQDTPVVIQRTSCQGRSTALWNPPYACQGYMEGDGKLKKSVMYSVRLTPLEYEGLKSKCEKSGIEVSEFVRSAMKGKNVSVIEGIPEMIVALNRIGNNINQIAKAFNYGLLSGAEADIKRAALDIAEMKKELFRISRKVDICQ